MRSIRATWPASKTIENYLYFGLIRPTAHAYTPHKPINRHTIIKLHESFIILIRFGDFVLYFFVYNVKVSSSSPAA